MSATETAYTNAQEDATLFLEPALTPKGHSMPRGGALGPNPEGVPSRSRGSECGVTLTLLHGRFSWKICLGINT